MNRAIDPLVVTSQGRKAYGAAMVNMEATEDRGDIIGHELAGGRMTEEQLTASKDLLQAQPAVDESVAAEYAKIFAGADDAKNPELLARYTNRLNMDRAAGIEPPTHEAFAAEA